MNNNNNNDSNGEQPSNVNQGGLIESTENLPKGEATEASFEAFDDESQNQGPTNDELENEDSDNSSGSENPQSDPQKKNDPVMGEGPLNGNPLDGLVPQQTSDHNDPINSTNNDDESDIDFDAFDDEDDPVSDDINDEILPQPEKQKQDELVKSEKNSQTDSNTVNSNVTANNQKQDSKDSKNKKKNKNINKESSNKQETNSKANDDVTKKGSDQEKDNNQQKETAQITDDDPFADLSDEDKMAFVTFSNVISDALKSFQDASNDLTRALQKTVEKQIGTYEIKREMADKKRQTNTSKLDNAEIAAAKERTRARSKALLRSISELIPINTKCLKKIFKSLGVDPAKYKQVVDKKTGKNKKTTKNNIRAIQLVDGIQLASSYFFKFFVPDACYFTDNMKQMIKKAIDSYDVKKKKNAYGYKSSIGALSYGDHYHLRYNYNTRELTVIIRTSPRLTNLVYELEAYRLHEPQMDGLTDPTSDLKIDNFDEFVKVYDSAKAIIEKYRVAKIAYSSIELEDPNSAYKTVLTLGNETYDPNELILSPCMFNEYVSFFLNNGLSYMINYVINATVTFYRALRYGCVMGLVPYFMYDVYVECLDYIFNKIDSLLLPAASLQILNKYFASTTVGALKKNYEELKDIFKSLLDENVTKDVIKGLATEENFEKIRSFLRSIYPQIGVSDLELSLRPIVPITIATDNIEKLERWINGEPFIKKATIVKGLTEDLTNCLTDWFDNSYVQAVSTSIVQMLNDIIYWS